MSFKHFVSENKKLEDTFEYKRGLGMAQAFYGDKHNSKTDKEDFDDTCREIAKKVGIKDSKEVEAFVRWMETKMSFKISKGKPIKESDELEEAFNPSKIDGKDLHILSDYMGKFVKGKQNTLTSAEKKRMYELLNKYGIENNPEKGTVDSKFLNYVKKEYMNESDELLENNLIEAKLKPSDFKKGDKVKWAGTFGSREQDEEGTIIGFKDHEDYKNGYLIIKGKDGKEYKLIFSAVSLNESDDKNEKMFGMSKEELDNMIDDARSKKFLVMGILSDIQEVISDKKIQQKLNVAKYIIDKNMK